MPLTIWNQPPPPPRQRALGRPEIVAAAIAVADESGAAGLTMKGVAARLGAYTPMALYRYVHSKDGLVDLMLDAAAAQVPVPARPGPDWRADLEHIAHGTHAMIGRHGWYAELVHTRPPAGPHQMRRLEFMLAVLVGQGAGVADAMTWTALIDRHVFGAGRQESEESHAERRAGLSDPRRQHAAFAEVRDLVAGYGDLPNVTAWLAAPTGPDPQAQFALGLRYLLDGIAADLRHRVRSTA
ncbi:TetR/AcrR family transcriptional regulator C-terminal domain-containing protein [Dactylosporangium sp. CA-052675]|uniref:TetR/AcrR family transcriptional regulator C-terminal domain-containing protein n=1 Tax=Dactylosporangium sp. CA-052675 TaxID=3239927 RepID=UPI003D944D06